MQVNLRSVKKLFEPNIVYRVPQFQRRYVWTKDDQWEPLWNDVRDVAEKCLGDDVGPVGPVDQSHPADHFLGAVVVQHEEEEEEVEIRSLIDGQQRLITFQLLLSAIKEVVEGHVPLAAKRIGHLIRNGDEFIDGNSALTFKVQANAADQEDFQTAMSRLDLGSGKGKKKLILEARKYFLGEVAVWLEGPGINTTDRVRALERAVGDHVKMVVISLANADDEHLIFETLNARGTPLTDWDLTKNLVLNQGQVAGISADTIQGDILDYFEDDYWVEQMRVGGGAPKAKVDLFLNQWMIMRKAEPIDSRPRRTYQQIERYIRENKQGDAISVAYDMIRAAENYRDIDEYRDRADRYGVFLHRYDAMATSALTPLLLRVLMAELADSLFDQTLSVLESYFVRRQLCGLTSRGYYDASIGALRWLNSDKSMEWDSVLVAYLLNLDQQNDRWRWPTDDDIRQAAMLNQLYSSFSKKRLRVLLEGIEMELRSPFSDAGPLSGRLSVERIMPQAWRSKWDDPESTDDPELDPAARRDQLIQTLGNLTLVTKSLNSSLSNGSLAEKREALDAHSTLSLNKDFLNHSESGWDEESIRFRALRLADAVIRVWPRPAST